MFGNQPRTRQISLGGFDTPPPKDFLVLLAVLFVNFSLSFFTSWPYLLQLTPWVYEKGFVWQLGTYAFAGDYSFLGGGASPFWFLLSLLILYMFGNQVRLYLGRRNFWQLVLWAVVGASLVAVATQLLLTVAGAAPAYPFVIMQGQRILLAIFIAAFATIWGQATIYFMFVLPIQARWFLPLEILFAFMSFLTTKDFAGFLGVTAAVGLTYSMLTAGGLRRILREWRLRIERKILEGRLARSQRRRGMKIVKPDEGGDARRRDPWVH